MYNVQCTLYSVQCAMCKAHRGADVMMFIDCTMYINIGARQGLCAKIGLVHSKYLKGCYLNMVHKALQWVHPTPQPHCGSHTSPVEILYL